MNFETFLEQLREGTFVPLELSLGQTQGHTKCTLPETKSYEREKLGVSYARKFVAEDEEEDQQMSKALGQLDTVDELTSMASECYNTEPLSEHLTYVYESYSFETKPTNDLNISEYKDLIAESIEQNLVTIIKGQTGCGKSTQVPQYILDHCRSNNVHCNIVVTQPRRIAALSVARRVCEERNWDLGTLVGYQVALEKNFSKDTRLLYCTAGVLLQNLVAKKDTSNFTHIIVDEVHERDCETDFLLIILKRLLRINGNRTKLILMSATINTDQFAEYFSKTVRNQKVEPPVIKLGKETRFPVSVYYLDSLMDRVPIKVPAIRLEQPGISTESYEYAMLLIEVFHKIDVQEHKKVPFLGSVLVFLPGIHEIETFYEMLEKKRAENSKQDKVIEEWTICPLHSSVTFDEQVKVFKLPPKGNRKIILATNIAESSITVPDVKYVIDFCLMKMQVQAPDMTYSSLQLNWISKSQGSQRAGRVGRVMPGRVYRLVPQDFYEDFSVDCPPELVRCPLDTLVLKSKQLKMGNPVSILGRAMDPPDLSNIHRTILNLKELGGLKLTVNGEYKDDDGDLTFMGIVMAALPLDPRHSKLIVLGQLFNCLEDCVIMGCCMAVKSIFSTPFKQHLKSYTSKLSWGGQSYSDPLAYNNAYSLWSHKTATGVFKRSGAMTESEWTARYFLQLKSLREVARLEKEIFHRLNKFNIVVPKDQVKVSWTHSAEKALMLKCIVSGAAYPNFFLLQPTNEVESFKVLGGRNPCNTVYLTNFPTNQPGPLYCNSIRNHFRHCGSGIKVSFDGSCKVYLTFESSQTIFDNECLRDPAVTNTVLIAIYRCIKLRHHLLSIDIPALPPIKAHKRAKEVFGDSISSNMFSRETNKIYTPKPSVLPGLGISLLHVSIVHVDSPHRFWVHLKSDEYSKRLFWVTTQLRTAAFVVPLDPKDLVRGKICIAPYHEQGITLYYRAKIVTINNFASPKTATVFYLDHGNSAEIKVTLLKDYSEAAKAIGLMDEPGLAIKCSLCEVQPSPSRNPGGEWSPSASVTFLDYFPSRSAFAMVYSVVDATMTVLLYKDKDHKEKLLTSEDLKTSHSVNGHLIRSGYAVAAEESLISIQNHITRELAENNPGMQPFPFAVAKDDYFNNLSFESPKASECKETIKLKGPKSPLEATLYPLTRKCEGKPVTVDPNSINCILLDQRSDSHTKLLVSSCVSQSSKFDRLTVRNTTLMPSFPGLSSLLAMIFAPRVELRVKSERTHYIGALCGLGYNELTKESYNPENDMEIVFDVEFDVEDLEYINRIRFWMNHVIGGDSEEFDLSKVQLALAQEKIHKYLIFLLYKSRKTKPLEYFDKPYEWGMAPEEYLMNPQQTDANSVYPLIWAIQLDQESQMSKVAAMKCHLQRLREYAEGTQVLKGGAKCELCQVTTANQQHLKLHLHTSLHKTNYSSFMSSN